MAQFSLLENKRPWSEKGPTISAVPAEPNLQVNLVAQYSHVNEHRQTQQKTTQPDPRIITKQ